MMLDCVFHQCQLRQTSTTRATTRLLRQACGHGCRLEQRAKHPLHTKQTARPNPADYRTKTKAAHPLRQLQPSSAAFAFASLAVAAAAENRAAAAMPVAATSCMVVGRGSSLTNTRAMLVVAHPSLAPDAIHSAHSLRLSATHKCFATVATVRLVCASLQQAQRLAHPVHQKLRDALGRTTNMFRLSCALCQCFWGRTSIAQKLQQHIDSVREQWTPRDTALGDRLHPLQQW